MKTSLRVVIGLSVLVGCSTPGRMKSSLAPRASFDLGCKVQESQIVEITDGSYGVEACGCKATYASYPGWTLNSVSGETCKPAAPRTSAAH
jgi:hypothetical protein